MKVCKARFVIEVLEDDETGKQQIAIQGPVGSRMLVYGVAESLKDAARAHKEESAIQVPNLAMVEGLGRGRA